MSNHDFSAVPKIYNIPKNNYDDHGLEKINDMAKIEVIKHLKAQGEKTRNTPETLSKSIKRVKTQKNVNLTKEAEILQVKGYENDLQKRTREGSTKGAKTERNLDIKSSELEAKNGTDTSLPTVILSHKNPLGKTNRNFFC